MVKQFARQAIDELDQTLLGETYLIWDTATRIRKISMEQFLTTFEENFDNKKAYNLKVD